MALRHWPLAEGLQELRSLPQVNTWLWDCRKLQHRNFSLSLSLSGLGSCQGNRESFHCVCRPRGSTLLSFPFCRKSGQWFECCRSPHGAAGRWPELAWPWQAHPAEGRRVRAGLPEPRGPRKAAVSLRTGHRWPHPVSLPALLPLHSCHQPGLRPAWWTPLSNPECPGLWPERPGLWLGALREGVGSWGSLG